MAKGTAGSCSTPGDTPGAAGEEVAALFAPAEASCGVGGGGDSEERGPEETRCIASAGASRKGNARSHDVAVALPR
jgi:hypothetical protein